MAVINLGFKYTAIASPDPRKPRQCRAGGRWSVKAAQPDHAPGFCREPERCAIAALLISCESRSSNQPPWSGR